MSRIERVDEDGLKLPDASDRRRSLEAAIVAPGETSEKQLTALLGDPNSRISQLARYELEERNKRRGTWLSQCSLIRLIVVVAIIAACIGVLVPYHQSGWAPAPRVHAREQLDNVRRAILLYEGKYGLCRESDLHFLSPRYLTEVPIDPWGNAVRLDSKARTVFTLGADNRVGGQGHDADIVEPLLEVNDTSKEFRLEQSHERGGTAAEKMASN